MIIHLNAYNHKCYTESRQQLSGRYEPSTGPCSNIQSGSQSICLCDQSKREYMNVFFLLEVPAPQLKKCTQCFLIITHISRNVSYKVNKNKELGNVGHSWLLFSPFHRDSRSTTVTGYGLGEYGCRSVISPLDTVQGIHTTLLNYNTHPWKNRMYCFANWTLGPLK